MSFGPYVESGWALCRIRPGTKAPVGDNWQHRESAVRDSGIANGLMAAGLCHAWSGTCAIDVDNWDAANAYLKAVGIDLESLFIAEDSVQISSGRKGRGKLLYALSNLLPTLKVAPYKAPGKKDPSKLETFHGLELRCATAAGQSVQDVLPPTIHPDTGQPYEWLYGDPVMGHWSNLPPLPAALRALWEAQAAPAPSASDPAKDARGLGLRELAELIIKRDPDDYEEWIKIGQILHHETQGSRDGYQLWDRWSRQSDKYSEAKTQTWTRWNGFGQNDGTAHAATVGQLIQERVAAPTEFAINETPVHDPEEPEDTGATREIDAVLRPRVVYLLDQRRYYHKPLLKDHKGFTPGLDDIGAQALQGEAFDVLYTPFMPIREQLVTAKDGSKRTQTVVEDPRKCVKRSRRIEKVNGIGFHPGAGRVFVEEDGNRMYNEYSLVPVEPLRAKPHELDAWAFLCSRIEDDSFRSWLLRFFAHMLAKPGVKIQSAPLLVSDTQGTGKTTWMQTIPQILLGEKWVNEISSEQLAKSFNSYLARTWWVTIEELKTDGPRMDRIAIANKMKPWITSKTIPVEFKGLDVYKIYNRVQIGASSNFRDTMQLDNSDRRWGVGHVVEHAMTEAEKAGLFKDFLSTPRAPGVVRWLIQQENLTGFSPTALPPSTAEKRSMIDFGHGPWTVFLAECMADCQTPFDRDIVNCADVQVAMKGIVNNISRKQIATMLRKPPFNAVQTRTADSAYFCWRNQKFWEGRPAIEWEDHRETAIRPPGATNQRVPVAILNVAGEDEAPENLEFTDLLGAI